MNVEGESESRVDLGRLAQIYRKLLDKSAPHHEFRWMFFVLVFIVYVIRVWSIGGFYIVDYGLGIFLLNQFILFISPQFDPEDDGLGGDVGLPNSMQEAEEMKGFSRKLPEFQFWYTSTRAVVTGFFLTFFEIFNIPVFWPILLLYFIILFVVTMKKQIMHMIKHKYLPFSFGKPKYQSKK